MSDNVKLTKKQSEILEYLKKSIRINGFPPSIREICAAVNLKSTSSVHAYLEILESKGYISKSGHNSRSIKILDDLTDAESNIVMIPVVGTVAAGTPILAAEMIESYLPVLLDRLSNNQHFFLRVKGDSMVNAGILNDDLVLVEQTSFAENGDIIVALLGESATVKTFYKEKSHIRLQPENDFMKPIIIKDGLTILGKVIGNMRFFK